MQKTKKRLYRLEVTPDAYKIIEAESFLSGRTLKSIASEILSSHSSKEAKSLAASKRKDEKIQEPEEHRDEKPKDQMIIESKNGAATVADIPQKSASADTRAALSCILAELEAGREPTVNEIAEKMGLTTTGLGMALSKCGIKAKNTHRDNKTVRIYTKPMKERINEILRQP